MANLLVCRICLATDVKLYNMHAYRLQTVYENVSGINVTMPDRYPHYLCTYCRHLLVKTNHFKESCKRSHDLLKSISKELTLKQIAKLSLSPPVHSLHTTATEVFANIESPESVKEEVSDKNDEEPMLGKIKEEYISSNLDTDAGMLETVEDKVECSVLEVLENREYSEFEIETLESVDIETMDAYNIETNNIPEMDEAELGKDDMEVIVLTKEQQLEDVLARKDSVNYKNSYYKCELCYKGFMTDLTFRNHMARHDLSAGPHSCDICHTRWPNKRALKSHTATAHEKKYFCKLCNHVSRSYHNAREHIKWHQGHSYVCKTCGASFSKSTSHLTHVRLHHSSEYSCESCGDSFVSQNGLNIHKKKAHMRHESSETDLQFICMLCKTKFRSLEALTYHNDLNVNGACDPNMSHCPKCGECFENRFLLKEHFKRHKEDMMKCGECDRTFAGQRALSVHYRRLHSGIEFEKTHKNKYDVVCEICGRTCNSNATLIYHKRIHTGERPYQCRECPKSFSIPQRLQIHIRTHTGESPFQCPHCPKAFKHKAALNRHDRVHSGEKPYQCQHCLKSFSQSNSMKLHIRTVHLKLPAPYKHKKRVKNEEKNEEDYKMI